MDAEIKVWVRGDAGPLQFEFRKDKNVDDVLPRPERVYLEIGVLK